MSRAWNPTLGTVLHRAWTDLPTGNWRAFAWHTWRFGTQSLPLAVVIAALVGSTVVFQAGIYAEQFGARLYTGWAAGYALLWEFGPLLVGLVMSARVGARNAAEIALWKLGGQIEGLRGIGLDPFPWLLSPRLWAAWFSISALAAVSFAVGVLFESLASWITLGLPVRIFFGAFADMLGPGDLLGGMIKASAFGLAIAAQSCAAGLAAQGGAESVGKAAARAVVWSSASIFALDFLLTAPLARWLGMR